MYQYNKSVIEETSPTRNKRASVAVYGKLIYKWSRLKDWLKEESALQAERFTIYKDNRMSLRLIWQNRNNLFWKKHNLRLGSFRFNFIYIHIVYITFQCSNSTFFKWVQLLLIFQLYNWFYDLLKRNLKKNLTRNLLIFFKNQLI